MINLFDRIKKHRIISSMLPFQHVANKSKWWLKDKSFVDTTQVVTKVTVTPIEKQPSDAGLIILKQINRKAVLRISAPLINGENSVAKVFYLMKLSHMLKYERYGLDEAANLIIAFRRGLPVPEVQGYGQLYNRFGLVVTSIVLMEDLRGLMPINLYLDQKRDDAEAYVRILMRTVPVFAGLYKACCNHIDVNGGAIMLSENDDGKVSILDFQHAQYMDKPSPEVLMAEAGRLSRTFREYVSDKATAHWLEAIFSAIGVSSKEEKQRLFLRFQHYRDVSLSLSRKERKKIE